MLQGLSGPKDVDAGAPVEVSAPGVTTVSVTVSTTGEEFDVPVDSDGKARFEAPDEPGATLLISDVNDPGKTTEIRIRPSTG